jgi:hypothetical protein
MSYLRFVGLVFCFVVICNGLEDDADDYGDWSKIVNPGIEAETTRTDIRLSYVT